MGSALRQESNRTMRIKMMIVCGAFLFMGGAQPLLGQKKLTSSAGTITFTSNAQLEMIKAISSKVQGIINPENNQFAFTVPVKTFQGFNTPLQREHFNDNYMQSDQFPNASFAGKIIEQVDFKTDGTVEVRAKGNLDIHGQRQTRIIKSKITIRDGKVSVEAQFFVPLADHNISIPKIVNQKIATEIEVNFAATLVSE